jgi:glucose/arabinose dehydrogenase
MGWTALAPMARGVVASLAIGWGLALAPDAATAGMVVCHGDCAGDGAVSIADLVAGVAIALGSQPISACQAMDSSGEGNVTVDELIRAVTAALDGCPPAPTATQTAAAPSDTPLAPTETPAPPSQTPAAPTLTATPLPTGVAEFCDLPGSVQHTVPGISAVPGGPPDAPDLTWMDLPAGFCAHYYGNVGNVRQLRFAPGGELFVASPTQGTTSNGPNGQAAIIVLPDDDHDGVADAELTFKAKLPRTVGLLFAGGYLYYQDGTKVLRVPYAAGDRVPSGESEQVADLTGHISILHWPKALDVDDEGTIYVSNGGDETDPCPLPTEYYGAILKLDAANPQGTLVAKGFRNPISLRCVRGYNMCFAIELTRDYSTPQGGREKLLPIRQGDDWGFPCCATKDRPYDDRPGPACSGVAQEIDSFFVGNTPFDLDFDLGKWPDPWGRRAYVPLHGAYGSWKGARVVGIELDRMTGTVLPGSDLMGMSAGAMEDFATGWGPQDDPMHMHGRPTVVAFAPDGRLFLGNDTSGDIIWIAPMGLAPTP